MENGPFEDVFPIKQAGIGLQFRIEVLKKATHVMELAFFNIPSRIALAIPESWTSILEQSQ